MDREELQRKIATLLRTPQADPYDSVYGQAYKYVTSHQQDPGLRGIMSTVASRVLPPPMDPAMSAMFMAGPMRIVGPRFNPILYHGGPEPVTKPDPNRFGEIASEMGRGFSTTPVKSLAEEYATQHEAPRAIISEYRLKPGEKVFETGHRPDTALSSDIRSIKEWLGSLPDDTRFESTAFSPSELSDSLEHGWSPSWIDAATEYAKAHGANTNAWAFSSSKPTEFTTRDPSALAFKRSSPVKGY